MKGNKRLDEMNDLQKAYVKNTAKVMHSNLSEFFDKVFTCHKCGSRIRQGQTFYVDVMTSHTAHITCPSRKAKQEEVAA